ncbi:MAG: HAD family hydrolase [Gemmatimonas sp.]|nr:HAD family hydrolase [Gemmatimonas sp.]
MSDPIRIAMWSGPRNLSTAMMRSFGSRPDTYVADEPFYAAYLAGTELDHPIREEVLASQPTDWREAVAGMLADPPTGAPIFYQKHMTHHMLPGFGVEWMREFRNAFLIRDPTRVLASYARKRSRVTLADIGYPRQAELFALEADRLGRPPPVVEDVDVLRDPAGTLSRLCAALEIPWTETMLSWPAGPRATDGVWAPVWYDAVERSTGFATPPEREMALADDLRRLADEARPIFVELRRWKL